MFYRQNWWKPGKVSTLLLAFVIFIVSFSPTSFGLRSSAMSGGGYVGKDNGPTDNPDFHEIIIAYKTSRHGVFSAGGMDTDLPVLVDVPKGKTVKMALEEARRDPNVLYAEPNYLFSAQGIYDVPGYRPDDPLFNSQWGMAAISAIDAWAYAEELLLLAGGGLSEAAEIIVAVLDTGVDADHEDLAGKVLRAN